VLAIRNYNLEVHSWITDWINDREDILGYVLRYSYPVKTKTSMLELNVTAIHVPEKLAKQSPAQTNEFKNNLNTQ